MIKLFCKKKSKIGLVLGSGAARGLAHIGALKALQGKNINIDMIAGSSIGALIGACYAKSKKVTDIEELALEIDIKRLTKLLDPNFAWFFRGVIYGKKVKDLLSTIIGNVKFKDLKIPLAVITTDANTGEEVVIRDGSVLEAVRASISIPVIFMPVKIGDRFLMDGGIVDPIPVSIVRGMGADYVIACNVIQIPRKNKEHVVLDSNDLFNRRNSIMKKNGKINILADKIDKIVYGNMDRIDKMQKFMKNIKSRYVKDTEKIDHNVPSVFDIMIRTIYIMEYEIVKSKIKEADIIISPNMQEIGQVEFNRGKEAIAAGYKAAMEVLNRKTKMCYK
jgi:NTE family protein